MLGWKHTYNLCGWKKYAPFDTVGRPNTVYGLFKMKNIADMETRKLKWRKMRPIAPGTRHPMKRLLHLAGRAWHFISRHLPGEHFVMNTTLEVPGFLQRAATELENIPGKLRVVLRDIEGCFPNMPKPIIKQAALDVTHQLRRERGVEGVWVPRRGKKKPCLWDISKSMERKYRWFPFCELTRILQFSLDHAIVRMPNGKLLVQSKGIPMGDPLRAQEQR